MVLKTKETTLVNIITEGLPKNKYIPTFIFDFIPEQLQQELGLRNAEVYDFTYVSKYEVSEALQFLEGHKEKNIYNKNLS